MVISNGNDDHANLNKMEDNDAHSNVEFFLENEIKEK